MASPAYAASSDAPGQLKKTASELPAATPAPTPTPVATPAPAPQAKTPLHANAKTNATTAPSAPGAVKKATRNQAVAAPTVVHTVKQRVVRRTRVHRAAGTSASHRSVVRTRAAHRAAAASATARRAAAAAGSAKAGTPIAARKTHRGAAAPKHPAAPAQKVAAERKTGTAPLTSLSRAADRVVEVIPGAVVLALAGLTGLVLLLVARSLMIERQRGKALARSYGVTVEALATAIEAKDHTTGGHIERVRKLGLLLANEMIPRDARDPQMAYGFLLHDIGKLAVPDAILRAPGRLGEDEWSLMRRHPEEGVRMLAGVPFLDRALDVVRYHHERWDGGGYPAGLSGEAIPLWARIFSVVDALDAITAERPYREARSYEDALAEIRCHAGTQFDPAVVEALERLDRASVEPLLEPTQLIAPEAIRPVEDIEHLIAV